MANELQISVNGSYNKNGAADIFNGSAQVTITSNAITGGIISIGTGDEVIGLGDIGTIGYVFFKNLDAVNFVVVGNNGSDYPLKLKAGESCLVRWNAAAIHAKADTAACNLQFKLIGD
jgi:hypothetical protein